MVERSPEKAGVGGSIPSLATTLKNRRKFVNKKKVHCTNSYSGPSLYLHRSLYGYDSTQPPESLLKALLQSDCTGYVPVEKDTSAAAP